jgi:branched-chain amino acid transport system ATP-binding protein
VSPLLLALSNVTAGYGEGNVLHNINIEIEHGEIVALVGSNGVGKTTTLRCIMGIIKPKFGSIVFNGQNLALLPSHKIAITGISYCPEGRELFGNLSVYENLRIGGYLVKNHKNFKSRLAWIYELFPRLYERRSQLSASLSGGEQQMLAMGRALMTTPKLMLLDEPSLGLAPILVDNIYEKIREINRSGTSILLVEQNIGLALETSRESYVMEEGQIRLQGKSKELLNNDYIKNAYLGVS